MPEKPRSKVARDRISARLQLEKGGEPFLAPSRVDLLEAVGELGSITSAAKAVGLSYKAAWDAIEAMNRAARADLVTRAAGGKRGGGTQLTAYGQRVIELVRRIERDYADVIALLSDPAETLSAPKLRAALSLRTSARNQWVGRVREVTIGTVKAEVTLALGEDSVRAMVSAASVKRLEIAPGSLLCALVKATSITLRPTRTRSSDNQVLVRVTEIQQGRDQIEVSATLQSALALTAIVSNSNDLRDLRKGAEVVASFAPEHVVLLQLPIGRFIDKLV